MQELFIFEHEKWLNYLLLASAIVMLAFMGFNLIGQNINLIMVCIICNGGAFCHALGYLGNTWHCWAVTVLLHNNKSKVKFQKLFKLIWIFCIFQSVFYIKHSIWFKYLLVLMSLAMGLFMGAGLVDQHQNLNWVGIILHVK